MTTRKQVERNALYGKIFSAICFVGIPAVVVGYTIYCFIWLKKYDRWLEQSGLSLICAWWLWYYWNVMTMSGETTDYEEAEAVYEQWLEGQLNQQLDYWDQWHRKKISFNELVNHENEFKAAKVEKLAALEAYRTAKLSNQVVRFRHR